MVKDLDRVVNKVFRTMNLEGSGSFTQEEIDDVVKYLERDIKSIELREEATTTYEELDFVINILDIFEPIMKERVREHVRDYLNVLFFNDEEKEEDKELPDKEPILFYLRALGNEFSLTSEADYVWSVTYEDNPVRFALGPKDYYDLIEGVWDNRLTVDQVNEAIEYYSITSPDLDISWENAYFVEF